MVRALVQRDSAKVSKMVHLLELVKVERKAQQKVGKREKIEVA